MIDNKQILHLRKKYTDKVLNEDIVQKDPFEQLNLWLNEAVKSEITEPNAMILSTSTKSGMPSSRVVLLKSIENNSMVFFTNYLSQKAKELDENPHASVLFFWRDLGRQIRASGVVEKISKEESETYFKTRPYQSQISAWASKQSSVISSRKYLEEKFEEYRNEFKENEVPLPPFWGGYKITPNNFEFWQGRENRLHDRIAYIKKDNDWKIMRLSP